MSIHGVTFDNQSPTARDHGRLFEGLLSDGKLSGCTISYSGADITVGLGYIILAGRLFQITANETVTATGTSGYARLIAEIDLSQTASTTVFEQVEFKVDYAQTVAAFSALTTDDVNGAGTTYQYALAIFSLGSNGITAKVSESDPCQPLLRVGSDYYTIAIGEEEDAKAGVITVVLEDS